MANANLKQTVLVTSGSGFVGAHCVLQLLDKSYRAQDDVCRPATPQARTPSGILVDVIYAFRAKTPREDASPRRKGASARFPLMRGVSSPHPLSGK